MVSLGMVLEFVFFIGMLSHKKWPGNKKVDQPFLFLPKRQVYVTQGVLYSIGLVQNDTKS